MKHNNFNLKEKFIKEPEEFNKHTKREQLQYCLGGVLYMPATKDFAQAIISRKYPDLTTIAMCFEDACEDDRVSEAEENVLRMLDTLVEAVQGNRLSLDDVPLIFFRVRSVQQFEHFSYQLKPEYARLITGFIFPKFNTRNGYGYFSNLEHLNEQFGEILYGMPILEDKSIAWKETRIEELLQIRDRLCQYRDLVLGVRVGCTDFSSCFGVRRSPSQTIYDVLTVRDCLTDILNVFIRDNDFVVSAPVWEYFPTDSSRDSMVINGLLNELTLDRVNGFIGKTCIHPTQLPFINGAFVVTEEEFEDAQQILSISDGVVKGSHGMNEAKPHRRWAGRICGMASAYGIIKNE